MKKYLLLIISMVCAVTGAWASATITNNQHLNGEQYAATAIRIETTDAGDINSATLSDASSWANMIFVSGPVNEDDIKKLNTTYGSYVKIINLTQATGLDASWLTNLTGSAIEGIGLPDGMALNVSNENVKVVYSSNFTGAKNNIAEDRGDNEIDVYVQKAGGITTLNMLQSLYLLQYRTINLAGATGTINTSAQEYVTLSGTQSVTINRINNDPYTVDGCTITINMAKAGSKTFTELLADAKAKMTEEDATQTSICTLIVQGTVSDTELEALNDDNLSDATKIDLSGATIATGSSINNITLRSSIRSLVLPKDMTVTSTLADVLDDYTNLDYAYSPSSDCTATGPNQADETNTSTYRYDATKNTIADYVWVNKAGGLKQAFENEEQLRNSFYIKVASSVALTETDVNFNGCTNKPTNYLFLDFSESNLTPTVAASYTVTDEIGYRIILPNGWTGDQMAVFAANPNKGSLAAVYSYNGTGNTRLDILEIKDGSYMPTALTNPRIVRSGTTAIQVLSGSYNGQTYSSFGVNLLAAINNMDNANSAGRNVRTVSISTGSNLPGNMEFSNTVITTLELKNVSYTWAVDLNVNACTSLQTLNLNYATLGNVTAQVSSLTSVDLSAATLTSVDLTGAALTTALTALTMDDDTNISGNMTLKSTGLTSFTPHGTVGGDIYLNASDNLASLDVRQFTQAANKNIHIDADATDESKTAVISGLDNGTNKTITVPTGYKSSERFHPYDAISDNIAEAAYVPPMYTTSTTTMMLHEKNADSDGDYYIYWYDDQDPNHQGNNVTIGTSTESGHSLAEILTSKASNLNFGTTTYRRAKIDGPIASTDVDDLTRINCQVLDLSDATFDEDAWNALKTAFKTSGSNIHSNVRFVIMPDTCSRESIINGDALTGLTNVLSVIALNKITGATDASDNGTNLTSWNRVSGALQAAVVAAGNHSCQSWTKTPDGETDRNIYTSDISDFRECKISGLINSHDLSKGNQKLDANGHLSWDLEPVELSSGTDPRKLNGACTAYGPFSASFNLSVIDLQGAFFEEKGTNTGLADKDKRYYFQDMTLSALGIISDGTYKVVVPTDPRAKEIPADFMNCSTKIRAICIPSNIVAIRTRAFYTIDYVWTTATNLTGTVDPEGSNTKLDNGAKLKIKDGTTYIETSALIYQDGAYKENPAFTKECYVADYSTSNGGGTYTFGSNLRLIETGAFANAQPHVKDVYVLNTKAPECHVDAFNTVMYTGNGGYSSISGDQKIISRENYINNGFWITMLHYPRQTTTPELQRYTDPTREYSIATGERDGKGATLYFPNQSEFIRAYQQGTYGYIWNAWNPERAYGSVYNGTLTNTTQGWTASGQSTANALFDAYSSGENHEYTSFYKVDKFNGNVTAPKADITPYDNVYWSDAAYEYSSSATEGYSKLYPQSEIDSDTDSDTSGEKTSKDYRGWHQFVLNAYAANTVLKEEPYRSYITDDDWWTVCLPFSLTRAEAIQIFGTPEAVGDNQLPYVSRLLYVIRDLKTANISLCFSKNLMKNSERLGSANNKQHGDLDATTGVVTIAKDTDPDAIPDDDDIVMAAGVPYLIKPNIPMSGNSAVNRQFRIYKPEDYEKLTDEQKYATSPKAICNDDLYERIKASQELSGADQISLVESGICKVPVFMTMTKDDRVSDESHETGSPDDPTYFINSTYYYKSTAWYYAFVGSFYKSFMPQYAYYLGWNGKAQFFYKTSAKENVMTWTNETGVIIPTKGSEFSAKVTPAAGMNPAQWLFFDNNNASTLFNDAFKINNGSSAKNYDMLFDAENVNVITGVDMPEVIAEDMLLKGNDALYNINGQKVNGSSHLPKGIYIQNGKKHVVK